MKKLTVAAILISCCAAALAQDTALGTRIYHSYDSEKNNVTKISGEYWITGKNSQGGAIFDTKLQSFYESSDLTVSTSSKPSVLISTTSNQKAGAYYNFVKPVSLRNKSIRFRLMVSDWKQIKDLNLILSTGDDTFKSSYTLDLTTKLHNQTNGQWVEITAPVSNFYADNAPDVDNIKSVLWQVSDKGAARITTSINQFEIIDNGVISRISITVDDGKSDSISIKQIMDQHGMKGTIFIDPTVIGTPGFLTQSQVDQFAQDGWDIGGHSVNYNLKALSQDQLDKFIGSVAEYLNSHNYSGSEYFAFPNGVNDPRINESVFKNFKHGLNVDSTSNPGSLVSDKRINRMSVDRWTTAEQVKIWIDSARLNSEYLILNFHTLNSTSADDNTDPKIFEEIIKYLSLNRDQVTTVSKAVESIEGSQTSVLVEKLDIADVVRVVLIEPARQDFGVGVTQTKYSNPSNSYSGQELVFLSNYNDGKYILKGELGLGTLHGTTYLVGDLTGMKFLNKHAMVYAGVFSDVVNSVEGLQQGIIQTGWNVGVDIYNDIGGVSVSGSQSYFTKGNTQTGGVVKAYLATSIEGVHVYVKDRFYTNSQANNPLFYSPDHYNRLTGGVGWKKVVGEFVFNGWIDTGVVSANGEQSNATAWKFSVDSNTRKNLIGSMLFGSDLSADGNYRYNYVGVQVKYLF